MRSFTRLGIVLIIFSLALCVAANRAMAADQVTKFIGKAPGICLSTQSENKCRVKSHERLTLQLPEERFIDNIVFIVDDRFGDASNAKVHVVLDGRQIAKDVSVMEQGGEHIFSPGTRGRLVEIVPVGDGEVNILWLRVYGY
jgi:hypothetical protein